MTGGELYGVSFRQQLLLWCAAMYSNVVHCGAMWCNGVHTCLGPDGIHLAQHGGHSAAATHQVGMQGAVLHDPLWTLQHHISAVQPPPGSLQPMTLITKGKCNRFR